MNMFKSVFDFITAKKNEVDNMAGCRGVVAEREKLQQLIVLQNKHTRNLLITDGRERLKIEYIARAIIKGKKINRLPEYEKEVSRMQEITSNCRKKKMEALAAANNARIVYTRGNYGELIDTFQPWTLSWSNNFGRFNHIYTDARKRITDQYRSILDDLENRPDEHGWEIGGEWDKKGRGSQVSIDLYGADFDKNLYVIQVRQSFRRAASHYLNVRKSYFLIGRNENGNAFAHCVGPAAIRNAINREPKNVAIPETAVNAALKWIWNTDRYDEVIRHGDVAILPVESVPSIEPVKQKTIMVIDSHKLKASEIRKNSKLYARNPKLFHLKNQHPDVHSKGWCEIIIGRREEAWDFAPITVD